MALILINNYQILSFESEPFIDKYWNKGLSEFIVSKHGNNTTYDHNNVDNILLSCFKYFVDQFKALVMTQNSQEFFKFVFLLHEDSIELYNKERFKKLQLPKDIKDYFPKYRRILKLILEQSCDIELTWKREFKGKDELNIIQELYYLGDCIIDFSNCIAFHKMVKNALFVKFEENIFTCEWQNNYGEIYNKLIVYFENDYTAFFEEAAMEELIQAIKENFSIDYQKAVDLISFEKNQFSNKKSQTIEPYVLIRKCAAECNTSEENTRLFYSGLMLTKDNKLSIEDSVINPHLENRYLYRPILTYTVDDVEQSLIGENKIAESMENMALNSIHWKTIPTEWLENIGMKEFFKRKASKHDSLLEDEIEKIFINNKFPYCRNIKSFKQQNGKSNIRTDIKDLGEIDFIVINRDNKKIFISETKYNRARYDTANYQTDYSNFKDYEKKIKNKHNWLSKSLQVLQEHLKIMFSINYEIFEFKVEAIFFINTPTFYMFNGEYKAIPFKRIKEYIEGSWDYPPIEIKDDKNKELFTLYSSIF